MHYSTAPQVINLMDRRKDRAVVERRLEEPASADRWITKQELAAVVSTSTRTVDRWVKEGMPEGTAWRYIGGRRRYKLAEVLRWHDSR